ncbi:MAG: hypothetical protein FJX47_18670 [Alphaproteobacteria bacterium]|nr:hypothetical protein [Alphaproteobacteria bacterium]
MTLRTFETFDIGRPAGEATETVDQAAVDRWLELFPEDRKYLPTVPPALLTATMMRGYLGATSPRPPGNVHAGQYLALRELPKIGASLTTTVTCVGKEIKKDNRWIEFRAEMRDAAGRDILAGKITLIWAA